MLLEALILASEKAANIARKCRQDKHLFRLLIEEKNEDEANPRFVQDFKTLADVLIQETLKHDIGKKYPEIKDQIKGEETNVFCNALGESICVQVLDTPAETAELLEKALSGDSEAARLLAQEVHRDLTLEDIVTEHPEVDININCSQLGVWIDPIDSTAEYINAGDDHSQNGISTSGLKCVTVLIGVYNITTGDPIIGIVNQPFHSCDDKQRWQGKCIWGLNINKFKMSSLHSTDMFTNTEQRNVVCLSASEEQTIKDKLIAGGFELVEAAGAGYKMLATIVGDADAYLLSKSSTFKWDSCGPHGVLKSLSGDIIVYADAVEKDAVSSLKYKVDSDEGCSKIDSCANKGGIIAYRDYNVMCQIVKLLKDT